VTVPGNEAELLARVVGGDRQAFELVMRNHEDRVFSVCLRILGDRERALDATQDTFLTVFRKASQFEGRSAVGTWIYRIAVNACYDQLRKTQRRPTESLPEHVDPTDPSAEEAIESAALRPEIESALSQLPADFRNAVILADLEGLPLPEVAEVLGVPIGTVKSRAFRGRRLLAQRLGNQTTS
jgi:RNA polymerase sigma-70 factor (ECF subfamily)